MTTHTHRALKESLTNQSCTTLGNGGAQLGDPGHGLGYKPAATLCSFTVECGRENTSAFGQTWHEILVL